MSVSILFLDAQTKDQNQRVTSFGDDVESLVLDFSNWMHEHEIDFSDLWYADIFESVDKKATHIAKVGFSEDEGFYVEGTPGSTLNPYTRKTDSTNRIKHTFLEFLAKKHKATKQ